MVKLSHQEKLAIKLLVDGYTISESAVKMGIAQGTITVYLRRARKKLDARSTLDTIVKAIALGLITYESGKA
jgi:DNA-binding CsgD family transcriptional regulator